MPTVDAVRGDHIVVGAGNKHRRDAPLGKALEPGLNTTDQSGIRAGMVKQVAGDQEQVDFVLDCQCQ